MNVAYANYWERKRLLRGTVPAFPVRRWWPADGLSEIERAYFDAVKPAARLLDVGAGDLRLMKKLQAAGFAGEYHTQDIGTEYTYTFRDLDEVTGLYNAVICFDVIEHLPLDAGLGLIVRMADLIAPGGFLLVQTLNGRCIRNPLSWDMTHIHLYNLPDLWAFVTALGYNVEGYRIAFQHGLRPSLQGWFKRFLGQVVITQLLGADYTDNIALIAQKATTDPLAVDRGSLR
jgi:hypothetical protein